MKYFCPPLSSLYHRTLVSNEPDTGRELSIVAPLQNDFFKVYDTGALGGCCTNYLHINSWYAVRV